MEITTEEINKVAVECKFEQPNAAQLEFIKDNYAGMAEDDPTGYWALWIEQLLNDAEVPQVK